MVRLRFGPFVKIISITDELITAEIIEESKIENVKNVKGILHWVGEGDSLNVETRIYTRLFKSEFPGKQTGNILDDVNKNSKQVYHNSKVSLGMLNFLEKEKRW